MKNRFELHPLCMLFPRMAGNEFAALTDDIKANGLRQPIITHEGMILDGGNRYEACMAAGVKPTMQEYKGENLVTYVMSANFHRRHLSHGQQAAIVASATDWANAQTHGGHREGGQETVVSLGTVKARAALSGAGTTTQKIADKLARETPELAKQVAQGEKTLYQAVNESKPALTVVAPTTPAIAPEEAYTETDALRDQVQDLQAALVVANISSSDSEEAGQAKTLIAELRAENKILRINLKAVTHSRDSLMNELAQVKRQCVSLQAKAKKAA